MGWPTISRMRLRLRKRLSSGTSSQDSKHTMLSRHSVCFSVSRSFSHPIANSPKHRHCLNDLRPTRPLLRHGSCWYQLLPRGCYEPRAGSCLSQDRDLCVYTTPIVFRVLLVGYGYAVYVGESGVHRRVRIGFMEVFLESDQR